MIRGYLLAAAALPLACACAPSGGNHGSTPSAAPPAAMSMQQAAQAFGLIGTWAPDCNQPPSTDDEHAVYSLNGDGTVGLQYDDGPGYVPTRYNWTQAVLIDSNTLQIDGVYYGDNTTQHTVLQKNSAGQMRVFGNVDSTGKILVQNGTFANGSGGPPWESRCSS